MFWKLRIVFLCSGTYCIAQWFESFALHFEGSLDSNRELFQISNIEMNLKPHFKFPNILTSSQYVDNAVLTDAGRTAQINFHFAKFFELFPEQFLVLVLPTNN